VVRRALGSLALLPVETVLNVDQGPVREGLCVLISAIVLNVAPCVLGLPASATQPGRLSMGVTDDTHDQSGATGLVRE